MELNNNSLRYAERYGLLFGGNSMKITDDIIDMNVISFERALEKVQSKLELPKCNEYDDEDTEEHRIVLQRNKPTDDILYPSVSNRCIESHKIINTFNSQPESWKTQEESINRNICVNKSYEVNANSNNNRNIIIKPLLPKKFAASTKQSFNNIYNYFDKSTIPMNTTSCERNLAHDKYIEITRKSILPLKHTSSSLKQLKLDIFMNRSDTHKNPNEKSYPVDTKCKNYAFIECKPYIFEPMLHVKNINALHLETDSLISPKLTSFHSLCHKVTEIKSEEFLKVNHLILTDYENSSENTFQKTPELICSLLDKDIEKALGKYETQMFEVKDAEVQVDLNQTANAIHKCNCLPYHTCEQFKHFRNDKCIFKREVIALDLATVSILPEGKNTILHPSLLNEVLRKRTAILDASHLDIDLSCDSERAGRFPFTKSIRQLPEDIYETKQSIQEMVLEESAGTGKDENSVGTKILQEKEPFQGPVRSNLSPLSVSAGGICTLSQLNDFNSNEHLEKLLGNKNKNLSENLTENVQRPKPAYLNVENNFKGNGGMCINLSVNEHFVNSIPHSSEVSEVKCTEDISSSFKNHDHLNLKQRNLKRSFSNEVSGLEETCSIVSQFGGSVSCNGVSPPRRLNQDEANVHIINHCNYEIEDEFHQDNDMVQLHVNHEEKALLKMPDVSAKRNAEDVMDHKSVNEVMIQRCSKYSDQNVPDIDDIAEINAVQEPNGNEVCSGSFHWSPLHSSQVQSNAMEGCVRKPFERFLSLEGVHKRRRLGLSRTERPISLHPKINRK